MREPLAPPQRVDFLGVPLCRLTTNEFIDLLLRETLDRCADPSQPPFFVTYLNAACSNLAAQLPDYREILHQADVVYADGQAIVWASRWVGSPVPERVNAADFFISFSQRCAQASLRLFFVGSAQDIAEQAAHRMMQQVPGLKIVGALSGFFEGEGEDVIARIKAASPDILIVGRSVPLQERWAWKHRLEFGAKAIWCVGALFEYYSGHRLRAPVWMRRAGLEWLFRLLLEPRRLWRRYVIGNIIFVWRVAREIGRKRRG